MASRLSPRPEWIRSGVRAISPYTPGEQPKVKGLIKLNTNENPYPPAPQVLECIKQAVDGRLRLYPNPRAQRLREALARHHGVPADHVMVGNGSDELLALATRAFVEPLPVKGRVTEPAASTIQFWVPSYSLYPVLASIHGARLNPVALAPDYGIPSLAAMRREGAWDFKAALSLVTTPNAPTGRGYATATLASLCRAQDGVVILDEAYADFASEHAIELVRKMPNVIISRTFSKSYSLCFQRIGYFIGHPALIQALDGIRDSYNVNGLGQVAAEATLKHGAYYRANFRRIIRLREQVSASLIAEGFEVLPSQTNFLFARPPGVAAKQWFEGLRKHKILVRWFASEGLSDRLRVTIGSESEMDAFLNAVGDCVAGLPRKSVHMNWPD